MKRRFNLKKILVLSGFAFSGIAFGQVGINTQNPQAIFHVDGAKDNPVTGTPSATQQANDFVVTAAGKVGLGTNAPGNVLEIRSTGNDTGLKLPNGAASGKILTCDANGNASWQSAASVFVYSEIHSTGNNATYPVGNQITFFHTIKGENVKTVYGNAYGWNDSSQTWIAPYTGKYRVSTNAYFNPNLTGATTQNQRVYCYVNGTTVCNITSVTTTRPDSNPAYDQTAYTSAIVTLNQGDYLIWKAYGYANTNVYLYGSDYHTFIRVESVE